MKYIKLTGFAALLFLLVPSSVSAIEITVTGNGADSNQEVVVQNEQTNQVSQTNDANVVTNIDAKADSGGNTANDNAGGTTQITTGDVSVSQITQNSANHSSINSDCCGATNEEMIIISDNGVGSVNSVQSHTTSSTQVNVNQKATISNTTRIRANSGGNIASSNGGNVEISTGTVTVESKTTNKNINTTDVYIGRGGASIEITITGNGADSENIINYNNHNIDWVSIQNSLNLGNITLIDADSGNNQANANQGDVTITTGDVVVKTEIENKDINNNETKIDCCQEDDDDDDDDDPPPVTPPGNGGNGGNGNGGNGNGGNGGSSGSGNGGQVLGMSMGQVLPAAGTSWFFYMTLANIFTFLFGLYLRLRGGRSPSLVYARV